MIPKVRLLRLNFERRKKDMEIGEHSHRWYEFVYYLTAEGRFTLGGRERNIKPGRFTVIRPDSLHSERHFCDGDVIFCIFECDTQLPEQVFDDDTEGTVRRICEALAREYFSPGEYSEELIRLMFEELIIRTARWGSSDEEPVRNISDAAEFIERRCAEQIDLRGLARSLGFGYDYFHHIFKKKYGLSPKQYQMHCRTEMAKQLLVSGRYSCTEVAYLSGFSDSAQFSFIFKRECGVAPSKFVRES